MMTVLAFLAVAGNLGFAAWFRYAWYRAHLVKALPADYSAVVVASVFWLLVVGGGLIAPWWMARRRLRSWDL
jgi:hypothetical protein